MPVIPLPLIIFIILLLPWAIVALIILYLPISAIVRIICEKKHKKESDACTACPDYMEGKDEDL